MVIRTAVALAFSLLVGLAACAEGDPISPDAWCEAPDTISPGDTITTTACLDPDHGLP